MDTATEIDSPLPAAHPTRKRRFSWLWGAVGAILLVLVSRSVTSDLVVFSSVTQRSCQGGYCVERVHTPDWLFVPGTREIHLRRDAHEAEQGRFYSADDPFDASSNVTITWNNGGVSISDGVATLIWSADTLARLED
ncbi:MAG TPA: hypothetical protein VLL08_10675 [Kineosporiaceae bacterium]|nr:hypothetical protein [Kineosporiaceae bacterium]